MSIEAFTTLDGMYEVTDREDLSQARQRAAKQAIAATDTLDNAEYMQKWDEAQLIDMVPYQMQIWDWVIMDLLYTGCTLGADCEDCREIDGEDPARTIDLTDKA